MNKEIEEEDLFGLKALNEKYTVYYTSQQKYDELKEEARKLGWGMTVDKLVSIALDKPCLVYVDEDLG